MFAATSGGMVTPASSQSVGSTSMCAVTAGTSTPSGSVPCHRQNDGTRVPPRQTVFLAPRMPALNTLDPVAVPLSVVNTTSVSPAIPSRSTASSSLPTFASMFSIMP